MKISRITPRRPSGFPEYLPAEQIAFNKMLATIRTQYELAGFGPIETPALELAEVLLAKGGGETEQEVFRFSKGSKDYVMHYDLTVPLARYVAEHQNDISFPFRRSQIQKVWRAERTQKGRAREFYQCDADIVGESDVAVDGEMIALAHATMRALNVGPFTIRINNRKILNGLYEDLGLLERSTELLRIIDKLEKIGESATRDLLKDIGLNDEVIDTLLRAVELAGPVDTTLEALRALGVNNSTFITGLEEIERAVMVAEASGIDRNAIVLDCAIARGLDYYTATVFETIMNDMPELGSVCSGGRFDDLASYYSERALPGVGISVGITRLFDGLKAAGALDLSSQSTSQVMILPLMEKAWEPATKLAQELRTSQIACEVVYADAKPAKVFSRADKMGIDYVAVIGDQELADNTVALKNMQTGEQKQIPLSSVAHELT